MSVLLTLRNDASLLSSLRYTFHSGYGDIRDKYPDLQTLFLLILLVSVSSLLSLFLLVSEKIHYVLCVAANVLSSF